MAEPISRDEIRRMVRELLRDVAGVGAARPEAQSMSADAGAPVALGSNGGLSERVRAALQRGGGIEVSIASDSDLNAFAQQVALCALERDLLGAIASNRVRFRLAADGGTRAAARGGATAMARAVTQSGDHASGSEPGQGGGACHWERGLLNETKIAEIAQSHDKLVLGPQAVLTPLARDRAGHLRLKIVRMKR